MGTEEPALDAVVAADAELMALRAEEADIQARLGAVSLEDAPESPPEASTSAANDADNDRLAAIYDRLAVRACPCLYLKQCTCFLHIVSCGRSWRVIGTCKQVCMCVTVHV